MSKAKEIPTVEEVTAIYLQMLEDQKAIRAMVQQAYLDSERRRRAHAQAFSATPTTVVSPKNK